MEKEDPGRQFSRAFQAFSGEAHGAGRQCEQAGGRARRLAQGSLHKWRKQFRVDDLALPRGAGCPQRAEAMRRQACIHPGEPG